MSDSKLDEPTGTSRVGSPPGPVTEGRRSLLQIKVDILRAVENGYG